MLDLLNAVEEFVYDLVRLLHIKRNIPDALRVGCAVDVELCSTQLEFLASCPGEDLSWGRVLREDRLFK